MTENLSLPSTLKKEASWNLIYLAEKLKKHKTLGIGNKKWWFRIHFWIFFLQDLGLDHCWSGFLLIASSINQCLWELFLIVWCFLFPFITCDKLIWFDASLEGSAALGFWILLLPSALLEETCTHFSFQEFCLKFLLSLCSQVVRRLWPQLRHHLWFSVGREISGTLEKSGILIFRKSHFLF